MEKQTNTKQVGEAAKSRGDTVAAFSQPFSLASGDTIAGCSLSHEQGEVFRVQTAESCHPRLQDLGLAVLSTSGRKVLKLKSITDSSLGSYLRGQGRRHVHRESTCGVILRCHQITGDYWDPAGTPGLVASGHFGESAASCD